MSKVTQTFTTDDKEFIAGVKRMQRELIKLAAENKKLAAEAKKNTQEQAKSNSVVDGFFRKQESRLSRTIAQHIGVGAAIGAVTQAYHEQQQQVESLAKASSEANRKLAAGALGAGGAKYLGKSRQFLETTAREEGVTREQAQAALESTGTLKGISIERRHDVARAAVGGVGIGADPGEFAAMVSALAKSREGSKLGSTALRDLATQALEGHVTPDEVERQVGTASGKQGVKGLGRLSKRFSKSSSYVDELDAFQKADPDAVLDQQISVDEDQRNIGKEADARYAARVGRKFDMNRQDATLNWAAANTGWGIGKAVGSTFGTRAGANAGEAVGNALTFRTTDEAMGGWKALAGALFGLTKATDSNTQAMTAPVYDVKTSE